MKRFFNYEPLELLVNIASGLPNLQFPSEGGYFCHTLMKEDGIEFTIPEIRKVGSVPPEKRFGRMKNCLEKVLRIIEFNLDSSFKMRDEKAKQYGGGIRFDKNVILSFSGFPEKVDEAICIIFASLCYSPGFSEFNRRVMKEQESYPDNEFIPPLFEEFYKQLSLKGNYPV